MQDEYDTYTSMYYRMNHPQTSDDEAINPYDLTFAGYETYCLDANIGHLQTEVCASNTLDRIYCVALYYTSHTRLSDFLAECAYITCFAPCFIGEYSDAIATLCQTESLAYIYKKVLRAAVVIKKGIRMEDPNVSEEDFSAMIDAAF